MMRRAALLAALVVAVPALAQMPAPFGAPAAIGEWIETEGARVRVLIAPAAPDGTVEGAVEIDLDPGWHTYWVAPGPTGIAPHFEAERSENVTLLGVSHPAPRRFEDAFGTSIGYARDVAFPLDLALTNATAPATLRLNGFLGVCDDICVPVSFAVEGEVRAGQSAPLATTMPIGMARMALPVEDAADALTATLEGDAVVVAGLPATGVDVFVAPPAGLALETGTHEGTTWRAAVRRGEPVGELTVVVREGGIETLHRLPIDVPATVPIAD